MISWIEVTVKIPSEIAEAVSSFLFELGSSGVVTEDTISDEKENGIYHLKGYFLDNDKFSSIFYKISSYLNSLREIGFNTGSDRVTIEKIKNEDLSENWKQHFKTMEIGKNLVIKPPWEVYENRGEKICIQINPARAFGTGGHPTTRLCLILLEEACAREKEISSMLDVGCGSGILAITGKKLNVEKVVGVDNDPIAVEESYKNIKQNDLENKIEFFEAKLEDINGRFSLIVANIYSGPICRMMPVFKEKLFPNGKLITSGIMNDQEDTVLGFAEESGFTLEKRMREDNWSAFLFTIR